MAEIPASVQAWLFGDDTGISSKAIVSQICGIPSKDRGWGDHPHDPDDFGRCYRLLRIAPESWRRVRFPVQMPERSPEWAALAGAWDELTTMYESVVGPKGHDWTPAAARKMYERMRGLIDGAKA